MSNLSTILEDNSKSLKSSALHYKIYYIILFVMAGMMILIGIPLLLALGLGLIYIAIGILYIFIGLMLKKAQESISQIATNPEISQEEYNENSIKAISQSGKFFKTMNIVLLISIIIGIVGAIILAISIGSLMNNPEFRKYFSTDSYQSSYKTPASSTKKTAPMMNSGSGAGSYEYKTPEGTMTMDKDGNIKMKTNDGKTMDISTNQKDSMEIKSDK